MEIKNIEVEKSKRLKIIIGIIIPIFTLIIIYFSISIYFINRFYFRSVINGINLCGKTVSQVEEEISAYSKSYELKLEQRGDKEDIIKGTDIGLKYNLDDKVQVIKDSQNSFGWIYGLFNTQEYNITQEVLYDDELLKKSLESLHCFESGNAIEPESAKVEYKNNEYVIIDEIKGNKVKKDTLYENIKVGIVEGKSVINIESIDAYENPKYTSESKEVVEAKNALEKYTASKIVYNIGENTEVLDESIIHDWLSTDDDFGVLLNEAKVGDYINTLAINYGTIGATREFTTSLGNTVGVGGGDYGWAINGYKETQDLISMIKEGQSITKEPTYAQTASSHGYNDIGNTYVEINLTTQHMWFYKNGSLVVEGPIVTGDVNRNMITPPGVYMLKYKEQNAILRGEDYATPVSFWMPFNGDIGLHDATWRPAFGGEIYINDGSHGCVNAQYNVADTIFNNINPGNPVICYY